LPIEEREFKVYEIKSYLTEFDPKNENQKLVEEGVEHKWTNEQSSQIKTGIWKSNF
jgi:hypothetical protein